LEERSLNIDRLLSEIASLKSQLFDANSIIDAIKEGAVDALVLHNDGLPRVYSLESADYTYRILIEKFSEGALSITEEGLILYCNDYFSKLLELPADKITGTYLYTYFDLPQEFKYFISALKKGKSKRDTFLSINNRKIPVNISFTDLHPTVAAIGVVVIDLAEKKKHEEALIKYQRDLEQKVNELATTNTNLSQFIHVISHDLKEPLRKMLMYTSRLNPEVYNVEEHNPLNIIKSSALRLNSLVDDLVKYAFTTINNESTEINLNEVVQEVKDDLEIVIQESKAVIEVSGLPVITGSRVQMRQLFSNLIANAIKYSKKDSAPQITISYEKDGPDASGEMKFHKISIRDNGIGMDNEHLSKIFIIFQRLHHKNEYSGNGIGLAICKKIMENHSGRIEVTSELNKGSTFNLFFPITNQ
jgi:signal transduction histidine kinase